MTLGMTAASPHHELGSRSSQALRAEVGDTLIAGTGYQAALLARLAAHVVSWA